MYSKKTVLILGAGASIASSRRNPIEKGQLPSMDNFIEMVGLEGIMEKIPPGLRNSNFEKLYNNLHREAPNSEIIREIEKRISDYFSDLELQTPQPTSQYPDYNYGSTARPDDELRR